MKFFNTLIAVLLFSILFYTGGFAQQKKELLVCGDSKVLIVDYQNTKDSIPNVVWTWDAREAMDLPEVYRSKYFQTMDDCKAIEQGSKILVSSSSGGLALLRRADKKVLFYAHLPNVHSIEMLTGNKIIAAGSTAVEGNRIQVYSMKAPFDVLFSDSLYSGHGVVWDETGKTLFALGFDELRGYTIQDGKTFSMKKEKHGSCPRRAAMICSLLRKKINYRYPQLIMYGSLV